MTDDTLAKIKAAAARVLQAMNPEYNDGPSMHVENMTLGRAVIAIRALGEKK